MERFKKIIKSDGGIMDIFFKGLIAIIGVCLIVIVLFGLEGLILWGIGNFIIWAFGINFVWTFWNGVALSIFLSLIGTIIKSWRK